MADDETAKRGRGRPRTASGPRVNVYLGSDQAARALRNDLESIQASKDHNSLSETVRFLVEQWKSGDSSVCDASTQAVATVNSSTQCSLITDNHREHQRVHVVTVGSQCLPMQSCTSPLRDQIQMFSMPFVSVTNSPYISLLQAQRQFDTMGSGCGPALHGTVSLPVKQEGVHQNATDGKLSQQCSKEEQKHRTSSPAVIVERLSSAKRRAERASITDTTKKALLECIKTRKSTYSSPRVRGRRGRKRGRRTF